MPNKLQMYHRTAAGKGFLQHFRLLFDTPSHIKGVCSGLSKEWIIYYSITNNDTEFWKQYGSGKAKLKAAVDRQINPTGAIKLNLIGNASKPTDHVLWSASGTTPSLKYFTCAFKNLSAHAMAGSTPGSLQSGQLFDPNVGQFDIGNGHYLDWKSLWSDMWEYYDLYDVTVYTAQVDQVIIL